MLTTSFVFSLMYGCKNARMKNAPTLFNRVCYSTKTIKKKNQASKKRRRMLFEYEYEA